MRIIILTLMLIISSSCIGQNRFTELEKKYNFIPVIDLSTFPGSNGKVAPKYIDGKQGLNDYIRRSIKYPTQAKKNGVEGIVVAYYYIDSKGKMTGIEIESNTDTLLNNEFIRVLQKSGPWIPATKNGKFVKMKMTISYEFKIN
jgi:TonB family protein